LSGCSTRYKRISFDNDTQTKQFDENTIVVNEIKEETFTRFPVYKISKRDITEGEMQEMFKRLGFDTVLASQRFELEENRISGTLYSYADPSRGYFDTLNLTDEELEKLAWETFGKIPFLEGEYEYLGITRTYTISSSSGTHVARAGVSFRRVIDGMRVLGEDECYLYFDGSGLVEIHIELYDYKKIDTYDIVPLEDAFAKIKEPDSFVLDYESSAAEFGEIETLKAEKVDVRLFNQYSNGCTILQPVYSFVGTATNADGKQAEFKSIVIAIPENYTHD
jgi:hypothetical protein